MKALIFVPAILLMVVVAEAQVQLALEGPEWVNTASYEVKGRHGIMIKQRLYFGKFFTTSVDRSWTKGLSNFQTSSNGVGSKYRKLISNEYIERNQTLFFTFDDSLRHKADVHCATNFNVRDITVANTGIRLPQIFGKETSSKVFYAQIYTSAEGAPWHLMIDKQKAQEQPKTYSTRVAKSDEEFYTITPYRLVKNNKGKVTEMTFGSAGFQFRNRRGEPVAAVSLINKGVVYLKPVPPEERFVLAAACAALLLEEEIETE